jgi:hypothetical protein
METLSRRSFLVASAGAAGTAAFLVAPGIAGAAGTDSQSQDRQSGESHDAEGGGSDLIVHVRSGSKGEIVIYSGENEIVVTDRKLASAIARSANGKG